MIPHVARLLLLSVLSSAAQAASICRPQEVPYFRCSFSGKTAVLCGAVDQVTGGNVFQYRISRGRRIEMQYSGSPLPPESGFRQSSILLAHGGEIRVSFSVGEYKYVLYETWDTRSPGYGGIYVLRNGKLARQYHCEHDIDPKASFLESGIKKLLQEEEYADIQAAD